MNDRRHSGMAAPEPRPGGRTFARGSPGYDAQRDALIWNARLARARSPELIVRPKSARDVAGWVGWAARRDLRIAMRGSGHNYQAASLQDGGLLIDLAGLDTIEIDPKARWAKVGAGVTGGRLVDALSSHGLAFPIGHCADVALSGFILSGGIGWNYGQWGAASANLAAVELVTANGELIRANAENHADLFWAARGAGCAFFAAVTGFELLLHETPRCVATMNMVFPAASARAVAQWLSAAAAQADPTVEIICLVGPDPNGGDASVTVRAVACGPDAARARAKLGAFNASPLNTDCLAGPEYSMLAFADLPRLSSLPSGKRVAADQLWCDAGPAELMLAVAHLAGTPSKFSTISITALGGGATLPGRFDGSQGAMSRLAPAGAGIYALWDEPEDDRRHLDWVAAADEALAPFRTGRYVGEADLLAAPDRIDDSFAPDVLARLRALRQAYDPDRRFHCRL